MGATRDRGSETGFTPRIGSCRHVEHVAVHLRRHAGETRQETARETGSVGDQRRWQMRETMETERGARRETLLADL